MKKKNTNKQHLLTKRLSFPQSYTTIVNCDRKLHAFYCSCKSKVDSFAGKNG